MIEFQPTPTNIHTYTSDQINSTRIITNSSGAVVYSALFDPYGGKQIEMFYDYKTSGRNS